MMSLSRQSRVGKKALVAITILVSVLFVIDLLTQGSIRSFVRGSSVQVSGTGSEIIDSVSQSNPFISRSVLQSENERLRREIADLTLRLASVSGLQEENKELRELLDLSEDVSGVTASVISSYRASPYGTYLIDRGSAAGIEAGSLVLAGEGSRAFLVGRVSEVTTYSSLISQIFTPGATVEAVAGDMPLTIEGQGGGNGRAEAPRALEIIEGQIVTAPSLRGFPIGLVGRIDDDATSATKKVYVGFPVNLASLKFVHVVPQ